MNTINQNALNGLFLWGTLSATQLSWLTGVSLSLCSRQLRNLVASGVAEDLGRTKLPPADPLYGRYFSIKKSNKVRRLCGGSPYSFGKLRGKIGPDKLVKFSSGVMLPKHYIFSIHCAAWAVDLASAIFVGEQVMGFPEAYLRRKLGWHHYMGPARTVANPKFTMVPDALVVAGGQELKIEAEITLKSAGAYKELFFAARPSDDNILYIYPDQKIMKKTELLIPSGYRVFHCIFGDAAQFRRNLIGLFPSLSGR